MATTTNLSDDLLIGSRAIARELGDRPVNVQRAAKAGELPTFTFRGKICARRSTLREHFERLERANLERARVA